ncbi:VOC family protein [Mycobacterium vicinigordonae]|uniref:VOC family protein n=1 Tax=Mycobacterium vicinigordonae TaxID=1719132 RepID=A0A7D6DZM0_9MYCO|nr:VOC family protein [Mycobacterium vicinigordonae]QLL07529.1 VOC family protein [Mycobacterium vicinigordonae]
MTTVALTEHTASIAATTVKRLPLKLIRSRIQHLNIQVADLDDMSSAYRRAKRLSFDITLCVGQHTNDNDLSFYATTPTRFEWELGWNPTVIDETTWQPSTHQGISIWGHTPEGQTNIDELHQFRLGATSRLHREDTVPALSGPGIADN